MKKGFLNRKLDRTKQAGYTLIELMIVITFIASALVIAFITYPKVQAINRANVESQHLTVIAGGIKNLYSTSRNFGTLTNTVLINAKLIPDDMTISDPEIQNVWGGTVTVQNDSSSTLRYQIVYTQVPTAECVKMATGVSTNFLKATVGATTILDRISSTVVDIDPATATTACQTSGGNTLTFIGN